MKIELDENYALMRGSSVNWRNDDHCYYVYARTGRLLESHTGLFEARKLAIIKGLVEKGDCHSLSTFGKAMFKLLQ